MATSHTKKESVYIGQPAPRLTINAPVQNQWYTIFDQKDSRGIAVHVAEFTTVVAENMEERVILDGVQFPDSVSVCGAGTEYYISMVGFWVNAVAGIAAFGTEQPVFCKSIQILIRKTTNAGVGAFNYAIRWSKKE